MSAYEKLEDLGLGHGSIVAWEGKKFKVPVGRLALPGDDVVRLLPLTDSPMFKKDPDTGDWVPRSGLSVLRLDLDDLDYATEVGRIVALNDALYYSGR